VRRLALAAAVAALALAGCGDDDATSAGGSASGPLVVSAAASLRDALTACSGDARLSFAGSDELAAQIRQGVRPDVFAAANTKLPDRLAEEGLLATPRTFIGNELVLAVPAEGGDVASLDDLAGDGVTLAIGAEGVPVGDYTRTVLGRLPGGRGEAVLANVRSNEPDVKGVVGKLAQGAVDAGFVYRSDVDGAKGALRAIALPERLRPVVAYGAAAVRGSDRAAAAERYVADLVGGRCHRALLDAGFIEAPSG
jgi:molybdate transport system substrate-binding protein